MNADEIKETLQLIAGANLHRVNINLKGFKMKVEGALAAESQPEKLTAPATTASDAVVGQPEQVKAEAPQQDLAVVKSTMVGTFYAAASPGKPAFIQPGKQIAVGDTVGTIKALQLFHDVTSDLAGTVEEILVKEGESVEFDQPLFTITKHV
ncbi:acetyl-CoA carboxylase biotin carboxyl carrier protein [Botryobacter ruber]|uniref:acetyl-CoA carboxylase biotin carboxyl carrier protein n=1 Tax=Botryobacter ruber TaxID=2171629 RepID=UPI000E0B56F2|nr:biotin/lipoyl-containing protein [Botryobacter ruber]